MMGTLELESMDSLIPDAVALTGAERTRLFSGPCSVGVRFSSYRVAAAWVSLLLMAAPALAQDKPDTAEAESVSDASTGDTPRSAITRFFELSRRGDYEEAAKFLELPVDLDPEHAPEQAKRLRLVLDHYSWIDPSKVSAAASGNTNDGLSYGVDEVARLPIDSSLTAPVRLVRRNGDARWRFSRVTVQHVDEWYARLPNTFWLRILPEPFLRMGPSNLLWGQWATLPLFFLVASTLGMMLSRGSLALVAPVLRRSSKHWSDELVARAGSPLSTAYALLAAYVLLPVLGLYWPAHDFADRVLRALLLATVFWALARSVDVAGQLFARSQWGRGAPATRAMLLFGSRIAKVMVAAFALVTLFSELGYPVTSLLAGLGVGGIAVALSAQKSLENLIGAFSIAVDQPFREGDFVRVDNMVGTVELIGMRSTRIRTLDRTLVSIPNGKLADMRIETFAARDRVRLGFTFGLTYATTEQQLRAVMQQFDALLRNHPKIWPEGCGVSFNALGDAGLMIEVGCWFATNWDDFVGIRQELLLGLMKIVEESGTAFAFPVRNLQFAPARGGANNGALNMPNMPFTAQG